VLELLVSAGLLVVIMLGLLAMFYQTEKAFRLGLAQADILVGGRSALELILHDLEQMRASEYTNAANFYVDLPKFGTSQILSTFNNEIRTNILQPFFFLTQENKAWRGVRYDFEFNEANGGAATLYRMEVPPTQPLSWLNDPVFICNFMGTNSYDYNTNLYGRIAEGVVHLAIRCFDKSGNLINYMHPNLPSGVYTFASGPFYDYSFAHTNLPAYVEVELGILEPKAIARFKATSLPNQKPYLERQAKRVHLFKQRIPIRSTPVPVPNERAGL